MTDPTPQVDNERQQLAEVQRKGALPTLATYVRMSGPGWLQSAITLGGGSLASSLIMGVLAGLMFLWVQPLAMALGIVMLAAIAYVTTTTRQRPFAAINEHVSPVLGWAWLLASLAANMFWCLPQYALATGVLQENLLPELLGVGGSINQVFGGSEAGWVGANASTLLIAVSILVLTTLITWAYDSGNWGIKLYELVLKLMVASIVISFFAVLFVIRRDVDWGAIAAGFVPNLRLLVEPAPGFHAVLQQSQFADFWSGLIVSQQQDVIISAAATAVGINMTFLFPYSILAKGWTREFRGLAIFDLSTGMLIPFTLATSCIVIAAASQLHARPVPGFFGEMTAGGELIEPDGKARASYYGSLNELLESQEGAGAAAGGAGDLLEDEQRLARLDELPEADRRIAAMLVERSAFDLARALSPLARQQGLANAVFGLGVLGMALSTITLLMLISGFCVTEALGVSARGWPHRLGALAAATGVLGPFIWSKANFYLAVYVSAFGLMLLPIAYFSFFFLMNRPALLGADMPRGKARWCWNTLMAVATTVATLASLYTIHKRLGWTGIYVMVVFVVVALGWRLVARKPPARPPSGSPA